MEHGKRTLSLRALERVYGINRRDSRRAIEAGDLIAYRRGKRWFQVFPEDVETYIRRYRVSPASELDVVQVFR
jgi:hypothetical protein